MGIEKLLRWWADRVDPPKPSLPTPEVEMPELPPGCTKLLDTTNHAHIPGHPEARFKRHEMIYTDATDAQHTITIKDNLYAEGCGHSVERPGDLAFISTSSGLPVCIKCERRLNQLRAMTKHEDCVCWHPVAPYELKRVEGKGYMCKACLKEHERFRPLEIIGGILGLFIKPLIIEDPPEPEEVDYEEIQYPPAGYYPPVQHYPPTWPGYSPKNQPIHEMGQFKAKQPNHHPRTQKDR